MQGLPNGSFESLKFRQSCKLLNIELILKSGQKPKTFDSIPVDVFR